MGKKVPDKLYFRIGEVSRITGIKPFVLRYWETEFPRLAPLRRGSKQRLYRKEDGGAAAIYFKIKGEKVYNKNWDAIKTKVVE